MKKLLLTLFALLFWSTVVYGANVIVAGNNCITVTGLDEDFVATDNNFLYDLDIFLIIFYPSATNDVMIVRDGGVDASAIFDSEECADAWDRVYFYYPPGTMVKPVIDISDCTLGTAANAKVKIYFR